MTLFQELAVLLAGTAAGTINTVVGSGTLITFPVLLALGVPPLVANVSNSVGLFPGAFAGAYGYREELIGQRHRIVQLGTASIAGAVVGALLLLWLPSKAFQAIVPILILVAVCLVLVGPRIGRSRSSAKRAVTPMLWALTAASAVYGGYFGAAQGVLLMGLFALLLGDTEQRHNALKNLQAGLVNFVAAAVFVLSTDIDWAIAGLLAAGSILGGVIGARIGRKLSPALLRGLIVVAGLSAIAKFVLT